MHKKLIILMILFLGTISSLFAKEKPNVILLMTDDQGYGDISAHGNPVLKTPQIDQLREQCIHFTDFHVAPMCTPTRGELMTGMDAMHNGATAVCQGRSMVKTDIELMPQFFKAKGYTTGIFGKWHLGDSYPYQPRYRGFDEVLSFRAWGITSLADYWGNTYFDPVLTHNGTEKKYTGYCTDIFFNEAIKFMKKCQKEGKSFFTYIPTNSPHKPDVVAENYSKPYQGKYKDKEIPSEFYGMIANIDENIGKLEEFLIISELRDNTIFIYLSDNGTQCTQAFELYNAGMRAKKGKEYEGGHRVPLYIRWIDGKLQHGTDIAELTQVQDLLPTLIELCGLDDKNTNFDGTSLAGLLTGKQSKLNERMCVSQFRTGCTKWQNAVVMWDKWRLIHGKELYDLTTDPGQKINIYNNHPHVVKKMSDYYENWYPHAKNEFDEKRYIVIGHKDSKVSKLYSNDWQGDFCDNSHHIVHPKGKNGFWELEIAKSGTYQIELRRWPEESGKELTDSFDGKTPEGSYPITKANLKIGKFDKTIATKSDEKSANFKIKLKKGYTTLNTAFLDKENKEISGALYVKITRK